MAVITRADSGLGPHRAGVIPLPVRELWLHHGVVPFWVGAQAARNLQQIARSRGFLDISYSWLADRVGNEVEGRGWGRQGAHTAGRNSISHAVCLVGNLQDHPVPDGMIRGAVRLVRRHARYGTGRITGPHSAAPGASTACPGRYARARIPAINTAASGTPAPPQEDDMSFTAEDRQMLKELHLGRNHKRYGAHYIRDNVLPKLAMLPTLAQVNLVTIAAARLVRDEKPGQEIDLDELAAATADAARQAVTEALPAALADLTPAAVAAAVVDALPAEHAQQVVDELAARLDDTSQ